MIPAFRLLYDLIIQVFVLAIKLAAFFSPKARLWVQGRKQWRERLIPAGQNSMSNVQRPTSNVQGPTSNVQRPTSKVQSPKSKVQRPTSNVQRPTSNVQRPASNVLWLHAASLGEFEQGRPVIEACRERFPDWKIVLTFYSPSGYEVRKDYPHADLVCYLPADTRQNARDFLDLIQPDATIFVKYEFWANYLFELKKRGIPTLLVSALFRPSQPFFQWYGGFWRRMLGCFTHTFVQNESSGQLLQDIGIHNFTIAGDTRVDRVLKIADGVSSNEIVEDFVGGGSSQVLVVGSSWEADEAVIFRALSEAVTLSHRLTKNKLVIAPHEPSEANVQRICKQVGNAVRYSRWFEVTSPRHEEVSSQTSGAISSGEMSPPRASEMTPPQKSCLVIDNIGLLNTLYRYGTISYIGGGFGKGIHNTLEPAAFGLPILFGPKYEKFEEARQFVARGGAFPVRNAEALVAILDKLQDPVFYQRASNAVRAYLEESRGATEKVMEFLEEKFGRD